MEGGPERDVVMEDASAPPPRLPREGDAAAPGGGQGEEYFDPFPELSDEDKGGDISENGVEGGPAVPDALPEISQDMADLIYGAAPVAAVVDEVPEEHAPDDVPPPLLTVKEKLLRFEEQMAPKADALRRVWRLLQPGVQVSPMEEGSGVVGPQANAAAAADNVEADLDDLFGGLEVEAPTRPDIPDSPACVWKRYEDVSLTHELIGNAVGYLARLGEGVLPESKLADSILREIIESPETMNSWKGA